VAQFEPKSLALTNRKHWHKLNRVIHQPSYIGNFAVIITEGNCSDTSFCIAGNAGSGVGLKHLVFTTVDVYPQPVRDILNVDLSYAAGKMELRVYNLQGQLVYREDLSSKTHLQLSCSAWKSGFYVLRLSTDETSVEKKLLIQH